MKDVNKETKKANVLDRTSIKNRRSIIAMTALALGSALAISSMTFAWFCMASNAGASMTTFSGDLGVSIRKVSAYKYVFPYHNNSVEFIDYDSPGTVKSYVVEDSSVETPDNLANKVTFSLGKNTSQPYVSSVNDATKSPAKIHYDNSRSFNYYLVGNSTFIGSTENEWSSLSAYAFARKDAPVVGENVTLENVVVSIGSEFILFNATSVDGGNCDYFTYNTPTTTPSGNARFTLVDNNRLKCLKSGIYKFEYRVDSSNNHYLDITLTSRSDDAIIGTNLIDPTKITIDYRGSASATYGSLNDYLPHAIQEQNTMVVLDVELAYQNKNAIDAGLKITRNTQPLLNDHSINGFSGKYNTTNEYTYRGVIGNNRNPLNASDFYAFYAVIAQDSNAYATPTAAWTDLHDNCQTDYETIGGKKYVVDREDPYHKFSSTTHNLSFDCDVHPKEYTDSTLVPGAATDNIYHCYIAIDYDYEYMRFFTNQERVGKTYYLDRDFQFYFSATEHLETPSAVRTLLFKGGDEY